MANQTVALVTGANKGIGQEIARQLGQRGSTVLIGARDQQRGEAAAAELRGEGIDAHWLALDVSNPATIAAAAERIAQEWGKLDVLVNNAAVLLDNASSSQLDPAILRATYDTNVFGVFEVTHALLPLIRKAPAGRIVNMSSGLGSLAQQSDPTGTSMGPTRWPTTRRRRRSMH